MALYDLACANGHEQDDIWAVYGSFPPCPTCGAATTPRISRRGAVRDDSFIGGRTFENLADHPVTFHSKTAYRAYLKRHNLEECVRHVPMKGSDKSPHTVRWGGIARETLEGATKLLERVGLEHESKKTYIAALTVEVSEEAAVVRGPQGLLGGGDVGGSDRTDSFVR